MKKTVANLCEFIWELEDKYDLLDYEIDDVKVWQYIRMEIYYLMAKDLGILEARNVSQQSFYIVLRNLLTLLKNLFIGNPFLMPNKQKEALVFTHGKSTKIKSEFQDIYTMSLVDDLKKSKTSYLCFEKPYMGRHVRSRNPETKYLDFILTASVFYGIFYNIENKAALEKIKKVELDIKKHTEINIDIMKLIKRNVGRYKLGYFMYSRLFRKFNPKTIYSVASYSYLGDMIAAAKNLGIKTVELQHGVVSKYHMGYSFPKKKSLLTYSNVFYSWGKFWNQAVANAFDEVQIKGYTFFRNSINNYQELKKEKKILILSQAALGEKIMNETLNFINIFSDHQILYKLHPAEYLNYKKYSSYSKLSKFENLTFYEDCDLYQLMSIAKIQIGVFSTSLYEGMGFSCKTYLLNLNGIEYMQDLLDSGYAKVLKLSDIDKLEEFKDYNTEYFF